MKDKKTERIEEQTPIIDGDTRPDKQEEAVNMEPKRGPIPRKKEKKVTKERGADVDSLEDFKDAK